MDKLQKTLLQSLREATGGILPLSLLVLAFSILLNFDNKLSAGETKADFTVYIFLTEDCKICQSYTPALRELHQTYAKDGFEFIGVFPNASSSQESMLSFQKTYALPFPAKLDIGNKISQSLGARLTPEVFVVDKASNKILYQGRIDNAFFKLGQRRSVITTHELQDALAAIKSGKPVAVAKTEAVGCFITPRKP
ncbi:redoxin family protein [candidate division KSB1 bacterium]|nr:redoxin family protein [candidate division KSB1 bacterium]